MVGLPARGKTFVSRKLARYLAWLGHQSRIFNVGTYRRDVAGASREHSFFDPSHPRFAKMLLEIADSALGDAISWLNSTALDNDATGGVADPEAAAATRPAGAGDPAAAPIEAGAALASPGSSPPGPSRLSSSVSGIPAPTGVPKSVVLPARVAIYDATNSTRSRRAAIVERCELAGIPVMFVEMICEKQDVVMANIREVKVSSPDYVGVDPEAAVQDFINRIKHYEEHYQTLSTDERLSPDPPISFVKIIDVGERVIVHHVKGHIQARIVYFLMNLNITPRCIYFSRHGESQFNVAGRIGGDSDLSDRGLSYARRLPALIAEQLGPDTALTVWTSTLRRTIQTASWLPYPQLQWKALDELDSGLCDGLTYEEIEERYPEDAAARDLDKYHYRYRGGESYADLVARLEPVTIELERHDEPAHAILIVGHQAVLRALYAYFMDYSLD
ncbi:Fructose-2,6-bisphosphatase, partial [Cladochytrium tenue]